MKNYLKINLPSKGNKYGDFYIYLYAGGDSYTEYRFCYNKKDTDPSLEFSGGPNNDANCEFYRIKEAYIGKLENDTFTPSCRILQGGEVGFAFCEKGAGDFSGGFHGDEVMTRAELNADGNNMNLEAPYFGSFHSLTFEEDSYIFRCNTPSDKMVLHKQRYSVEEGRLLLSQYIEWLMDAKPLVAAYTPMLTVQRLDPKNTDKILTDTVEFYDKEGGRLLKTFDTTSYGDYLDGKFSESHCLDTFSTAVRVYGKESGIEVFGGYRVVDGTIPDCQIGTHLCIRFAKALDNKIYFNIAKDQAPFKGTVWKSNIFYSIKVNN